MVRGAQLNAKNRMGGCTGIKTASSIYAEGWSSTPLQGRG